MRIDRDAIGDIPIASVKRYLVGRGWRLAALRERIFELYAIGGDANGHAELELFVPLNKESSDFKRRASDLLRILSKFEDRSPDSILSDIKAIGFDVLKSILPNKLVHLTIHQFLWTIGVGAAVR